MISRSSKLWCHLGLVGSIIGSIITTPLLAIGGGKMRHKVSVAPDGSIVDTPGVDVGALENQQDFPGWVWGAVYVDGIPVKNSRVQMEIPTINGTIPITSLTIMSDIEAFPIYMFGTMPISYGAKVGTVVTMTAFYGNAQVGMPIMKTLAPDKTDDQINSKEIRVNFGNPLIPISSPAAPPAASDPDTIVPYRSISSGPNHTCMVANNGDVWCWGDNRWGQLGTGDTELHAEPTQVKDLPSAFAVSAGWEHTCALLDVGEVKCWGRNTDGQLGLGISITRSLLPADIPGLNDKVPSSVSAGRGHTCATLTSGPVLCWGSNAYGQLGRETPSNEALPGLEVGLPPQPVISGTEPLQAIRAIFAGPNHTCALSLVGTLLCWGENKTNTANNLLGDSNFAGDYSVQPRNVLTEVRDVATSAASQLTCAIQDEVPFGTKTTCWGSADGVFASSELAPTWSFTDARRLSAIAVGTSHLCLVKNVSRFGEVYCRGSNLLGQVGVTTQNTGDDFAPVRDRNDIHVHSVAAISAGYAHTCIVGGSLMCWGYNEWGQIGDGSQPTRMRRTPTVANIGLFDPTAAIPEPVSVEIVTLGFNNSCDVARGIGFCWGQNDYGQVAPASLYVTVPFTTFNSASPSSINIAIGEGFTCERGKDLNSDVVCQGRKNFLLPSAYKSHSAGKDHMCAVPGSGINLLQASAEKLSCVGSNQFGQAPSNSSEWNDIARISVIAAGTDHNCLIDAGAAKCFGNGAHGAMGNGTTPISQTNPITVTGLERGVTKIVAGHHVSCAIQNGSVKCWGLGLFGQMGNTTTAMTNSLPVTVPLAGTAIDIAVSDADDEKLNDLDVIDDGHVCALLQDGSVWCWGANTFGKLGNTAFTDAYSAVPLPVPGVFGAVSIDAGSYHTCARIATTSADTTLITLRCWGLNDFGQVGSDRGIAIRLPSAVTSIPLADWTMMLYLSGDTEDISGAMTSAARALDVLPRSSRLNIVVLLDGNGPDDMYLWFVRSGRRYWLGRNKWRINENPIQLGQIEPIGDMSKPETLAWFIRIAHDYFPAQHYYLSIADHGRGTSGSPWDNQGLPRPAPSEPMSPSDISGALFNGTRSYFDMYTTSIPWKFDVIHFDSCLMSLLEMANQVKDFADYMVASENLVAALYLYKDYAEHVIRGASNSIAITPENLALAVAKTYFDNKYLESIKQPRTISVLRLNRVSELINKLNLFLTALGVTRSLNELSKPIFDAITLAREGVQTVDESPQPKLTKTMGWQLAYGTLDKEDAYVDLQDFVNDLAEKLPNETALHQAAQSLQVTLQELVAKHWEYSGKDKLISDSEWRLDETHGLAIYFPRRPSDINLKDERNRNEYYEYIGGALFSEFTLFSLWDEFLQSFYRSSNTPSIKPVAPARPPVLPPSVSLGQRCMPGQGACLWGSVFESGLPVSDASVKLSFPGKQLINTLTVMHGPTDTLPIYQAYARPLNGRPPVIEGDLVIVTVIYRGIVVTQTARISPDAFTGSGQEISLVMGAGVLTPTDLFEAPTVTIESITVPTVTTRVQSSALVFAAKAFTNDLSAVVAYRWESDKEGVLNWMPEFTYPAAGLRAGRHRITLTAINEIGVESSPFIFSLAVDVAPNQVFVPIVWGAQ